LVVSNAQLVYGYGQVEFHFPKPTELSPPLIGLNDCCFKYPNLDGFALSDLNLGIDMGRVVCSCA
jgi:hypothetical protein